MSGRRISDGIRSNVWAIVLCFAVLTGSAVAASGGGDAQEAQPSASAKKQIKKLKRKLAGFEARLAALEGKPAGGPPIGPAGGDLTGAYPNPFIGPNSVGADQIISNSVDSPDLDDFVQFTSVQTVDAFFGPPFFPLRIENGRVRMVEIADPGNPPVDSVFLHARQSGGLTQLVARFADGNIDVLAVEAP